LPSKSGLDLLPSALVERMVRRREGRYAFPDLTPIATALVVVDMTSQFVSGKPDAEAVTAAVNRVARSLRLGGGLVMWIRPGAFEHPDRLAAVIGPEAAAAHEAAASGDHPAGRLWPGLDVQPNDLHRRKSLYSAFFPGASDASEQLKARGVDTVLIAGALTDVCCEASARDAFSCGFRVILIGDACIGSSEEAHAHALASVFRNFGDVRSSEEVIELLSAPG
jgi:nicotinamidase-related amidase